MPRHSKHSLRRLCCLLGFLLAFGTLAAGAAEPPPTLRATGLYGDADGFLTAPGVVEYQPRFPLWTDGLLKRRWIRLPAGTAIDASDPDDWRFPVGTKIWKEFAVTEGPVETRLMELTPDGWLFASYAWNAAGTEATLAPTRGLRGAAEIAPGTRHDIPGLYDCLTCHEAQTQRVLGFSAVQLTRSPGDGPDLAELSRRGIITGLPVELLQQPTSGSFDRSEEALGYLHGNCGHCHNSEGPLASLGLDLRMSSSSLSATSSGGFPAALATTLHQRATATARSAAAELRIVPGDPASSQLVQRLATRDPFAQMPPLGTRLVDQQAVDLLVAWIETDLRVDGAARPATESSAPASKQHHTTP